MKQTLYCPDPVWYPRQRLRRSQVPAAYWGWLFDTASLTRRIMDLCPQRFRVHVLDQAWTRPMANEVQALNMRLARYGLVRQVYLVCDDTPWVFARTVIPRQTMMGPRRRLAYLKSRSLGAMLFADPSMQRGEVEIAKLTPCDKLYASATQWLPETETEIWGRRSVFQLNGRPLLVSEFFLPAIGSLRL